MHLRLEKYDAPVSPLLIVTDLDGKLRALEFADHEARMHRLLSEHYGEYQLQPGTAPKTILSALDEFFAGNLAAIESIEVATGGTPFQRSIWRALRKIPGGATISYGQLAVRLNRPSASRAVGAANGANPIAIVVPCHRVIGANGTLTGYGGGLPRKRWLIDHERQYAAAPRNWNGPIRSKPRRIAQLRLVTA
ncbi:MAG TPA: methylated-DNA--[protein]-cysteine S-methyltransferase [Pirellulales bacterium]|jgi:O-6-methylguanine DNA methyltransferase